MDIRTYIPSQSARIALYILGGLMLFLLVFKAGVFYGYHRERGGFILRGGHFMRGAWGPVHEWAEPPALMGRGHGAIGTISAVALPEFTLTGRDGSARTVRIATSTVVRADREAATTSALAQGSFAVVFGIPRSDGSISAELIRILPMPSSTLSQ